MRSKASYKGHPTHPALIAGVVQCPWHGSQFDCRSGAVKAGPAAEPIATYAVSEREGSILLTLGDQ